MLDGIDVIEGTDSEFPLDMGDSDFQDSVADIEPDAIHVPLLQLRRELFEIRELLAVPG
jgi:hypothetical protein